MKKRGTKKMRRRRKSGRKKRRRRFLMRPPGFPPRYIFDVVNLELASNGCAPLENEDTDKLVDNDDFDGYSNAR